MPVPLTVRHRMRVVTTTCMGCRGNGLCVEVEAEHAGVSERTSPRCLNCLESPEHILVFEPPVPIRAAPAPPSKAVKRQSQKRERRLAEAIGGRRQPASGALPGAKGDVRKRGEWRIDDKMTTDQGFRLTRQMINKIRSECAGTEKPAITIGFLNKLTRETEDEVVVIDRPTWERFVNGSRHDQ